MAMTSAKKPADTKSNTTGKVRSVRIEPAENGGAVVTCDRESPKSKGKSGMMAWEPAKPAAFTDMESAIQYAAKELGVDCDMDAGEAEPDKK